MVRKLARGFTLIELMIVVAIIGILALIAIPDFSKFQNKAKQSEAKTNLKAFYTAWKSTLAEGTMATTGCGDCGFAPEKGNKYKYFLASGVTKAATAGTNSCSAPASTGVQTDTAFSAGAAFDLTAGGSCDEWKMDDGNILTNVTSDI